MNFKKGQKEYAELLRCLKDDKIHYYTEWRTGGAMPGETHWGVVQKRMHWYILVTDEVQAFFCEVVELFSQKKTSQI